MSSVTIGQITDAVKQASSHPVLKKSVYIAALALMLFNSIVGFIGYAELRKASDKKIQRISEIMLITAILSLVVAFGMALVLFLAFEQKTVHRWFDFSVLFGLGSLMFATGVAYAYCSYELLQLRQTYPRAYWGAAASAILTLGGTGTLGLIYLTNFLVQWRKNRPRKVSKPEINTAIKQQPPTFDAANVLAGFQNDI